MKFKHLFILMLLSLCLCCCTHEKNVKPKPNNDVEHVDLIGPFPTSFDYQKSIDELWPITIEVVATEYPIYFIDKNDKIIGCKIVTIEDAQFNTFVKNVDSSCVKLRFRMTIKLTEKQNSTVIEIENLYEGLCKVDNEMKWKSFNSNGRLEYELLTKIKNQE